MDDIHETKSDIRKEIAHKLDELPDDVRSEKIMQITDRLFSFANFLESTIALLYIHKDQEVPTQEIIKRCYTVNKVVVLPCFFPEKHRIKLMKVDNPDSDLVMGPRGVLEPNPNVCKAVPVDVVDIAIIPGIAFDEKGGRIGTGEGYYDRFIPKLSATTRKVSPAFESQIVPQVPMASHDKHVDIIITEDRIIYKI
ncbi:MAG: 5-formyltetrahydrofolate cyclo-ligase [Desulfobacterales bacterium]